jgi:hypothetical protein
MCDECDLYGDDSCQDEEYCAGCGEKNNEYDCKCWVVGGPSTSR